MRIAQLMTRRLVTVSPEDTVENAVKLLRRRRIRYLLVIERNRLVGIISDRDIKRVMDPAKTKKKLMDVGGLFFLMEPILVEEIMTSDPVTVSPSTSAAETAEIMVKRRFNALPVVQRNRAVGIVTETDLLRYFVKLTKDAKPKKKKPGSR